MPVYYVITLFIQLNVIEIVVRLLHIIAVLSYFSLQVTRIACRSSGLNSLAFGFLIVQSAASWYFLHLGSYSHPPGPKHLQALFFP